ncbi:hypothetical protein C8Q77DRAFT_1220973 [Trametes polyzona]|nr:hypothetical protein C8Q77DRAFT_1220973 [Trametes polyzona]
MTVSQLSYHSQNQKWLKRQLRASAILDRCCVKALKELRALRAKGWKNERLDMHFQKQRDRADEPPLEAQRAWFRSMVNIIRELDGVAAFIKPSGPFECAPGGFAPEAGISLPESQGGNALLLQPELMVDRFEYIAQDLLEYDLSPCPTSGTEHCLPPRFLNRYLSCDVMLVDDPDQQPASYAHGGALVVGQLIIALASVRPGGTIVVTLHNLVYLLDKISATLIVHKPTAMHKYRCSFYAIAKGVGDSLERAELQASYLNGLCVLWSELHHGGCDGSPRKLWGERDLRFIVTPEEILDIEGYLDPLVELGRPVWATQAQGLSKFFGKKGT